MRLDELCEGSGGTVGIGSGIEITGLTADSRAVKPGFLFAALQTVGAIMLPESAYKDVFAFAAVIVFMAWRPTGLIAEQASERV